MQVAGPVQIPKVPYELLAADAFLGRLRLDVHARSAWKDFVLQQLVER
jgi:hypothetical protein